MKSPSHRRMSLRALLTSLVLAGLLPAQTTWSAAAPGAGHAAVLDDYCSKCHNTTDWAGGVAFDTLDVARPTEAAETWEHTIAKLRGRLMPPAGEKQPSQGQIDALVAHLETSVDREPTSRVGHVPIQRLNRVEFAASVKSLLGVDIDARQILPTDIEVEGFSNIAGALGVSPSFVEQHLSAARSVAKLAVGESPPKVTSVFYRDAGGQQGQNTYREGFPLGTRGGVRFRHVFPADGEYRFSFIEGDSLNAGLYPNGMQTRATLLILVDGKEVARREIGGPDDLALTDRDGPKGRDALVARVSNVPVQIKAGSHEITATFIERSWAESNEPTGSGKFSGTPIIRDGLQVMGPFAPQGISTNTSRAQIFICQPQQPSQERGCAQRIARHLATRAFRRPSNDDDVRRVMQFYDTARSEGGGFDAGVTELVAAVLSSPDFLYRVIPAPADVKASRPLSNLELASRLAFFLWNGNPDQTLLAVAGSGKLVQPAVLSAQVERMLRDPRAQSLVENFALAWLNLDELDEIEPTEIPFSAGMRTNFETEIRLFLSSVLLEDRSVLDLINADWTFLNESLARHYGVRGIYGSQFRRVQLADENRWGLLGKGAVLLRTSYADRTSPVLRGAWVLDRLVGAPPAPPPPDVVTDLSAPLGEKPKTVRARLEAHRANATCQGCHGIIDPPGLALENFDVAGRWREIDAAAGEKIDATAELTSGMVLKGPSDLRRSLMSRVDQFPTTVARRLMMYALNREVEYFDMPQVRQIVRDAAQHNYTFESLIKGVVASEAFRRQGADEEPAKQAGAVTAQQRNGVQ